MRTKEEFENERYFGIQKFDTFEEALAVMKGKWGIEALETQSKLLIADDDNFKDAVLLRAIERVCEARLGNLDWEKCKMDLGLSKKKITDYLLDFDFLLYSKKKNCYFTSRMSYKDDHVNEWNKRQWGYYYELSDLYSFPQIAKKSISLVDSYIKQYKLNDVDDALDLIIDEEGLFF